jgi:integrase
VLNSGYGWDIVSLVLTSLDAAFRPVEVQRAHPGWVDVDNMLLRIPREDSSKNEDNWRVSVIKRTATALDRWLDKRDDDAMYDDRDELWLTREATPWSSRSLSRLIKRLCDDAGIETGGRSMTWYSIRHSTGTHLTAERDLKAAKDQLRHKSSKTTMKYDQVPVEDRRGALENM